jgi:hypothetical protein
MVFAAFRWAPVASARAIAVGRTQSGSPAGDAGRGGDPGASEGAPVCQGHTEAGNPGWGQGGLPFAFRSTIASDRAKEPLAGGKVPRSCQDGIRRFAG